MPDLIQFITFRLADALPHKELLEMSIGLGAESNPEARNKMETWLDAGYGACHLKDPAAARIVENVMLFFDGARYRLLEWVVMPNHVHFLIET
ncbi:MAG TPA: transposase, partial [Planctomycetota bacterium]|nr:transposase [Planctomycetota bacterium]